MSRMIRDSKTRKMRYETNTERLTRIMEYSHCGALMQCFIIDGIIKHAERVRNAFIENPNCLGENSIIHPPAWEACAKELCEEFGVPPFEPDGESEKTD